MTEERLKEIKKNIDLDFDVPSTNESIVIEELYNEVVRLRKILNCKEKLCEYLPKDTEFVILTKKDYERLTLEQLTGVENE